MQFDDSVHMKLVLNMQNIIIKRLKREDEAVAIALKTLENIEHNMDRLFHEISALKHIVLGSENGKKVNMRKQTDGKKIIEEHGYSPLRKLYLKLP